LTKLLLHAAIDALNEAEVWFEMLAYQVVHHRNHHLHPKCELERVMEGKRERSVGSMLYVTTLCVSLHRAMA
jgi:hypothetical protein